MASAAPIERVLLESSAAVSSPSIPLAEISVTDGRLFSNLRGIRWRIDLGILPSTSSIHDLRLATADSRRRYARLRRHLLVVVDPHERRSNSPELVIDNPLSQNPNSKWGQFFQTAELQRTLEQDLSHLCKEEQSSYFQTPGCQGMLRRILLLWCLEHPECGYRQGMLELLAPLLYVLQADRDHLSKTRKYYEDQFRTDNFNSSCKFDQDFTDESKEFPTWKVRSYHELDHTTQEIVSLTDAYGTEGELGVVISSQKYIEHDAYFMFDALMNTTTIDFFLPSVIESCSVWYQLLSVVDPALFTHLVELRVEPQYFALRWLRVLFSREFTLNNVLIIWDNIFQRGYNRKLDNEMFGSSRGVFVSAFAVSMIIYLRSSLLASENTASCLQKLLNFPNDVVSMVKLLDTAKSLSVLALDNSTILDRSCVDLSGCVSPTSTLCLETGSYWEGRWRILNEEEEEEKEEKSGFETKKIHNENEEKSGGCNNAKERKPVLWGKFQWIWKLGKNTSKVLSSNQGDKIKNLSQSMLQHIQVIESSLEEELCQGSSLSEREHIAAMTALKALRKSSNLLLEINDNHFLT